MKTGLFGYYQNGHDYLYEFARAKGWKPVESVTKGTVAFETGQYRIELSLIQPTGLDLSKESYLFQETVNEEAAQS